MPANTTVYVLARTYVDRDDCLQAAADDYSAAHGLDGWDLSPQWLDNQRDTITLTAPGAPQYSVHADARTGEWREEPRFVGFVDLVDWMRRPDTAQRTHTTYERFEPCCLYGTTCALEVMWHD